MGFARYRLPINALPRLLLIILAIASGLTATGCRAQAPAGQSSAQSSPPMETRRLREFGALGDGRADDTAAIQAALRNSARYCLDGEGRSYRVSGTLRVDQDLCLRNVTLVQSLAPFDTSPYIRRSCPLTLDASAVIDCGEPSIPAEVLPELQRWLSVRTLLIRPPQGRTISVILDHVKVDRGRYPDSGSRADSAGIWLQGANRADLNAVEVTGEGKGFGLMVSHSQNVTVDNLWIHDLVWSPYAGDAPISEAQVAATGWNSVPIQEFRAAGEHGVSASKFYGVRVQEQITCAVFAQVQNVHITNARVSGCMAKFSDGELPWQADGLDIGGSSSNVAVDGATIDSTWNAMDIVANGSGVDGLTLNNIHASNSFTYGLKFGYHLRNARISNAVVDRSGLAGIVLYGPVSGIAISGATISGVGVITGGGRTFVPWPSAAHSGIRLDKGSSGTEASGLTPHGVTIDDVSVSNPDGRPYDFAVLNKGGTDVQVHGLRASGFSKARESGLSAAQ